MVLLYRKGAMQIVGLVVLGVLLAVALGGTFFKGALLPGAETININGKTCSFLKPQFGRIECQPLQYSEKEVKKLDFHKYLGDTDVVITFGDVENSPEGYFTVKCINSKYFYYQTDAQFAEGKCPINSNKNCIAVGASNIKIRFNDNKFKPGEKLRIIGCKSYSPLWKSGTLYSNYIPYGLVVYDSGMKKIYNTKNCDIRTLSGTTQRQLCTKSDSNACKKTIGSQSTLGYDQTVNYLGDWIPVSFDESKKIVDYNGQKAFCQINTIYSLGEFETKGGCYYYPKEVIDTVQCCPGMQSAGLTCGNDFKWHPQESIVIQCKSDIECTGQGTFVPDYSKEGNYVSKWKCINNKCVKVQSNKVDCLPPDLGCPSGQVCNPNKGYICEYQKGNIPIKCGDGICSQPYESQYSCPQDCKSQSKFVMFLKRFFFAFLTSIGIVTIAAIVPFTRAYIISNIRRTIIIIVALTVIFALFFTAPLFFTASLLGGSL